MKNYTITVNGNVYDVTVEENGTGAAPVARPAAAPKAAPAAAPAAPKAAPAGGAGSIEVKAGKRTICRRKLTEKSRRYERCR